MDVVKELSPVVFARVRPGVEKLKELYDEDASCRFFCPSTVIAACFSNEADETDRRSMSSERLRFFRIGFLLSHASDEHAL